MNKQESDVLFSIMKSSPDSQRILSERTGYSLGVINRVVRKLQREEYISVNLTLTNRTKILFKENKPRNAIILAAGFGMRMVPINMETPKGLLEVDGEPLIERTIRQLHEAGIQDILIVVGFMKEMYEYLIDKYNVNLVVNTEYAEKNNLFSLRLVSSKIGNSYIIPCDIWCDHNPYKSVELYSWYMISDLVSSTSNVRVNRKMKLVKADSKSNGNSMIGICYLGKNESKRVCTKVNELSCNSKFNQSFWEVALFDSNKENISAKIVSSTEVVEINTYEQLRELDNNSNQLKSNAINVICQVLHVSPSDITDITVLKKGMTNRSFLFQCLGKKYIMRIPGEGTDLLINRQHEAKVYQTLKGKDICDEILYINPNNGYKITEFFKQSRTCDPENRDDILKCINKMHEFHDMKLTVDHEFNIFNQIDFYESLWDGSPSIFRDYNETKKNIFSLRKYIDKHCESKVLTHIDAVPDNFLFIKDSKGHESIRLIDWEYAGMQDPHVDIAMFCIYAQYDRKMIDFVIDKYFNANCPPKTRMKIYCYIACCGLLWSNWCEYKRKLGVEFGEYSLNQYRYARDYYQIVKNFVKEDINV